MTRESTWVVKKYLNLSAEAVATAQGSSTESGVAKAQQGKVYGSMTYDSVRLCRVVGDKNQKIDKSRRVPLLSGSGVSKGISIRTGRLTHYAEACRKLLKRKGGPNPPLDARATKLEQLLFDFLGVNKRCLRIFFEEVYLDGVSEDVGVLVEANFALNFELIPFTEKDWQDIDFHDAPFAKSRLGTSKIEKDVTIGNGSSHLQSLRIRIRMTEAEQKQRNVFGLGWATPNSGSYEGKSGRHGVGGSIFRSYAAGAEYTFDLYTKFFGDGADEFDEKRKFGYEYTVAPVALFNV